jgi:DNA-binding CsgD family transcriptional regulator
MKKFFSLFSKPLSRLQPPSAYSPQGGLSLEFIKKYGLTRRQTELTEVLLQGKSNKEIAALLGIELNTVQVHLRKIYQKTGVRGRYALMALVVGLGTQKEQSE